MKQYTFIYETRLHSNLTAIIESVIKHCPTFEKHIVYCTKENLHLIPQHEKIEIVFVDKNNNRNTYNNLLLTSEFWDSLDCDYVLIYQTDCIIYNDFPTKFNEEKYLGSFFRVFKDFPIINGGLSYRDVKLSKEFCIDEDDMLTKLKIRHKDPTLDNIPEDIFFTYYFYKKYKLTNRFKCNEFVNDVFNTNGKILKYLFGMHGIK